MQLVDEPTDEEAEKIDSSESGDEEVREKENENEFVVDEDIVPTVEVTDADPVATADKEFEVNTPEFSEEEEKEMETEEEAEKEKEIEKEREIEEEKEKEQEKVTDGIADEPTDKGTDSENLPKEFADEREGHGLASDRVPSDRQNLDDIIPSSADIPSAETQNNDPIQEAILTALASISNAQLDSQSTLSKVLENQARMQRELDELKRENASLHSQLKSLNSSVVETIKGESASITRVVNESSKNLSTARPPTAPSSSTATQQPLSSIVSNLTFAELHEELIVQNKHIQKIVAKEVAEAGNAFVKTIITDREEFMTKLSKMKTSIKTEVNSSVSNSLLAVSESFGPKIDAMKKALMTTAAAHDRTIEDHSGKVDRLFNLTNQSVQEITSKLSSIQIAVDELAGPPQGSTNAGFGNTHANEDDGDSYFFPAADSLNYHRRNLNILIPGIDPYFPEYID